MPIDLENLLSGYTRFRDKFFASDNILFKNLSLGQNPSALIVSCCDSRVDPAIILDCDPGELFVVRNVANLVPPYENDHHYHGTSAALEFGVCHLHVPHIILLGHSQCGGIKSLVERKTQNPDSFIDKWMELARCSIIDELKQCCSSPKSTEQCEKESLIGSLGNLKTFPWIKTKVDANELILHAWYFDLIEGNLEIYDETTQQFLPFSHSKET
jgi:carbonic anhydrase